MRARHICRGSTETRPCIKRLDAATLMLVLHHISEPARALAEVARVLKPGGRLLFVDMLPHDREHYRQQINDYRLCTGAKYALLVMMTSGKAFTSITQTAPGIASGRDAVVKAPIRVGLDEKEVQKPRAN